MFPSNRARRRVRSFAKSESGNVALMFGLCLIPAMGLMGAAVDYSRASSAKAAMQNALDATALILAKNAANVSAHQLQSSGTSIFTAMFHRPGTQNVSVTSSYNAQNSTVTVSGSALVPTMVLSAIGVPNFSISSSSTIAWGNTRLRVALVLDNTGSMADYNKIGALKTATQNLLAQLKKAAANDGDVYVSIIPFTKDVNVDPANYAQNWVRWDLWEEVNGTCDRTRYTTRTSCTSHHHVWTPANHNSWNGCVTDRDQNYDTTNAAPLSGVIATQFPAEQYGVCPTALMGLSYDWTALNNKVNAMQPAGNTNQAIGLQWGWQSLTAAPFTVPPQDPNHKYQQIIILLTDGLNTQDRWYTDQASIDRRQQVTCDNINAAGITLYTVQVNTGGDPTSTLLQNCAGSPGTYPDPGKFFLLTTADQIVTTFNQIAVAITQLHIAK